LKDGNVTTAGHSQDKPRIAFNIDWITRPVFGLLLAGAAIASVIGGGVWFALFISLMVIAASREYHRMVARFSYLVPFGITGLTVVMMLYAPFVAGNHDLPWVILLGGAALNLVWAFATGERPLWEAGGVLYLCIPAFAATLVRAAPDGIWMIVGVFVAIWATDTGALIAGNLIGGPKLAPVISPNKTWAGTLGGVAAATAVEVGFMFYIHGDLVLGGLYGAGVAVVAHAGDLFESWMKRRFQRKDSGSLIPGHGGVLDRIDSTLSTAAALAALVFLLHVNPLFGGAP
jgi:phosphatidate cytidylyltransferase